MIVRLVATPSAAVKAHDPPEHVGHRGAETALLLHHFGDTGIELQRYGGPEVVMALVAVVLVVVIAVMVVVQRNGTACNGLQETVAVGEEREKAGTAVTAMTEVVIVVAAAAAATTATAARSVTALYGSCSGNRTSQRYNTARGPGPGGT